MTIITEDQNIDNLISRQEQRLLLVRLQNDDFQALDDLVHQTYAYFFNFLLRLTGDKLDIDDILLRAYGHFLEIRHRLDSHREFIPILGRLIFEEVALAEENPKRKKNRKRISRNPDQYVLNFYHKLPLQQRIALHFLVLGKMDYATIAEILRQRLPEILPQLAAARRAFFRSLQKKRIIDPPGSISRADQEVLFAHPALTTLGEFAPKICKKVLKSKDMQQFIALIQKCDTLLRNSLARETCDECAFETRQRKLLLKLHKEAKTSSYGGEFTVHKKSGWRPFLRTTFALALFALSLFVWKFNRNFAKENLAGFFTQNAMMALMLETANEQNAFIVDSLKTKKTPAKNKKTAAVDRSKRRQPVKPPASDFDVQVRKLQQPRKEASAAMTISLRAPRVLNPFVTTMRKQEMAGSIGSRIKLWENFFEITADSSLYFPHIIQHLAGLYVQAADSSADALHLADAVAWFEQYDQILVSFFGDSAYTVKLDSLRRELQAARTGNILQNGEK